MNFKKLQVVQQEWDNSMWIVKPHNCAEERFNKTLCELSVSIAKVYDCDNKGKVDEKRFKRVEYTGGKVVYEDWGKNAKQGSVTFEQAHKLTLVEEASDCLHFILSLANQLEIEINTYAIVGQHQEKVYLLINTMIGAMCFEKEKQEPFVNVVRYFLGYVHSLGITEKELEQAYYEKNEENYRRLREGY